MSESQIIQKLTDDLKPRKFGTMGKLWVGVLIILSLTGLYSYLIQLRDGLEITALNNYVSWGIYISNFVFFVAVSLVGSLISAILRLSNAKWSIPLSRIAEIIAVSNIIMAGLIIIVDMGRPERFYYLFTYGRIQSPIVWDVIVVTTYLIISLILLFLPMLPDMAILQKRKGEFPEWQRKLYKFFSFGWIGNKQQYAIMSRTIFQLSILIIPVALAIHTVTSWLFATTLRGGWNSTNFGPYFVAGAFMVGAAAVIAVMYAARRQYQLQEYITDDIFDKMGKLLVMLSLVYLYFNINEYLTPAFKQMVGEHALLKDLFVGQFAPMFWGTQIFGMLIPIILMSFPWGRKPRLLFIISIVIIVGAWFKRYLIVIPTLFHPYLPVIEQNGVPTSIVYHPTFHEWSITMGSLAAALLIMTILFRYLPFISIWEMAEYKGVSEDHIQKASGPHPV
ncbi:MAG: polysulfide reductase NrfD [Chitinophagales bacterium]|nr:polysulfide reductase NrfD [Chitinophagales bacterium]